MHIPPVKTYSYGEIIHCNAQKRFVIERMSVSEPYVFKFLIYKYLQSHKITQEKRCRVCFSDFQPLFFKYDLHERIRKDIFAA